MSRFSRAAATLAGLIFMAGVVLLSIWNLTAPGPAAPLPVVEPEQSEGPARPTEPEPAPLEPVRVLEPLRQLRMPDYPLARVRATDRLSVQPYYIDNRVVFRRIRARSVGAGLQISGEILADFDCDKAPAALGLAAGPVMGLRINVQLYDLTPVLARGAGGRVKNVQVDPRSPGRPVEGQFTECRTGTSISGESPELALARFELPVLARPLAPGIYNLVASLTFLSQDRTQLQQIKWCSDFWGAEDEGLNPVNLQRRMYPIIGNKTRHDRFFQEVVEVQRTVQASARIYMAGVHARKRPEPNCVVWGQLADRIREVEILKGHPEQSDRDLAVFKMNERLQAIRLKNMQQFNPGATIKDVIKEQEELTAILRKYALDNLRVLGGPATTAEQRHLAEAQAAREGILEEIAAFQDYMVGRYWALMDGYITYGWHTVNRPGSAMLLAIRDNDSTTDARARQHELDRHDRPDQQAYLENLKQTNFKYQLPEVTQAAEDYLRRWPWTREMLSENFTRQDGGRVAIDVHKWRAYRAAFVDKFTRQTDEVLAEIDTTGAYANSMWPETLADARAARDDVICLAYAFEFQIRTTFGTHLEGRALDDRQRKQHASVVAEWIAIALAEPTRNIQRFIPGAQCTTVAVYIRYRQRAEQVRGVLKLQDFAARYKAALQAGSIPPGATRRK